jgi:hypothetical protein
MRSITLISPNLTHARKPRRPPISGLSTRNNIRPSVLFDIVGSWDLHSGQNFGSSKSRYDKQEKETDKTPSLKPPSTKRAF